MPRTSVNGKDRGFDYTRSSNPTRRVLEQQMAAIEGVKYGTAFASGMSAVKVGR